MPQALTHQLADAIAGAADLYHSLVLVVGPPRSGKSQTLRHVADEKGWPLININLTLAEQLLELTAKQRTLKLPRLLDDIAREHEAEVLILDNIELLFDTHLEQDPLRLLQGLARNRTIVASWAGEFEGEYLSYAAPTHPEYRRYHQPDAVCVNTLPAIGKPGTEESA